MFARKSGRKIPAYCEHKPSGRAYVRLTVDGGRETVYLGPYNSRESLEEYDRVVGDWLATKMTPQRKGPGTTVRDIGERFKNVQEPLQSQDKFYDVNSSGFAVNFAPHSQVSSMAIFSPYSRIRTSG